MLFQTEQSPRIEGIISQDTAPASTLYFVFAFGIVQSLNVKERGKQRRFQEHQNK